MEFYQLGVLYKSVEATILFREISVLPSADRNNMRSFSLKPSSI